MMERLPKSAAVVPLGDFTIGQRVMTVEGFPGTVDDVHEGPGDLTTVWVTLDNGMGGGEYAEGELQPLNQTGASVTQIEGTAAADYPELGSILSDRLPPQITQRTASYEGQSLEGTCTVCGKAIALKRGSLTHADGSNDHAVQPSDDSDAPIGVTATSDEARDWSDPQREDMEDETYLDPPYADDVANHLALYLPPNPPGEQRASTTDLTEGQKAGYDEGFAHGKEGITRDPSNPDDEDFRVGYDIGWAEGVTVSREPVNSWDIEDLGKDQTADVPPATLPTYSPQMMASQHEAGEFSDWMEANGEPGRTFSYDWCRFRRNSHCWLPKGLNEAASRQAGYAVWIPQDRGVCWRPKWEDQQKCPTGEPGPNSGPEGYLDATVPWEEGGQRGGVPTTRWADPGRYSSLTSEAAQTVCPICGDTMLSQVLGMTCMMCGTVIPYSSTENLHVISDDGLLEDMRQRFTAAEIEPHEFVPDPEHPHLCAECKQWRYFHPGEKPLQTAAAFEFTASWKDIREKAKRIRSEGGVRIVAVNDNVMVAHVKGDHGIYETEIVSTPGKRNAASWHCGCKWSSYSWGRSGPWKRYEGRMCSHALALQYEAQSRGAHGREMTLDEKQPAWMDQKHVHRPGDYDRNKQRYSVLEQGDHDVPPATLLVVSMLTEGAKYADIRAMLLDLGVERPADIVRTARRLAATKTAEVVRVDGEFRDIDIDNNGFHDVTGEELNPARIEHPKWHPTLGLDPADQKVLTLGSYYTAEELREQGRQALEEHGEAAWEPGALVPPFLTSREARRANDSQTTYFHVAPASARSSIEQHGLDFARSPSGGYRWQDTLPEDDEGYPKGNYFFLALDGPEQATFFRDIWAEHWGEPFDIWEVDASGMTVMVDPLFFGQTRYLTEPVPASRVKRVASHVTGAKQPPAVLYHYTSEIYLPAILASGHLRLTSSNIEVTGGGPPVVWLTTTVDPGRNGLDGGFGKGDVRFTVEPDPRYTFHWPTWAFEQGIEGDWYDALDSTGGNGSENWWVSTQPIGLDRVLTIEVNGVPYRTGAKKSLPEGYTLQYRKGGNVTNNAVVAVFEGKAVGAIQWVGAREVWGGQRNDDGTFESVLIQRPPQIVDLKVDAPHRRQGLATAMYEEAKKYEPDLVHDDIVLPDGEAWMRSLGAKDDTPTVSGLVLKAADTGRILMLQRSMDDDKASGKWEFPGGHHEDGDLTSLHAAIREWQEEVGQPLPEGGYVAHTWTSANGIYQGHLLVIPSEKDLVLHEGRIMENPDDPNSECCEQVAWWDPEDAKKNPALREECKDTPWAVLKSTAEDLKKAASLRTAATDAELREAARDLLEVARRNEPDTTTLLAAEALLHGGEMEGLDHRLKSEDSLLRKMKAEAHEFGGDARATAMNISDSLRYTMVFSSGSYTNAVGAVLAELASAGYRERVKNYWERGDAYNGINVAMTNPKGHIFELQFHTPESFATKKNRVHPIYERWRVASDPALRADLSIKMRDIFDSIPQPSGVLGIPVLKRQPMPVAAANAPEDDKYLLLEDADGQPTTVVRMLADSTVEVYRGGEWVEDPDYGRHYFLGEPRSTEISEDEAMAYLSRRQGISAQANSSRQMLEMLQRARAQMPAMPGFKFRSGDELILAYGKEWNRVSDDLPPGLERGEKKMCFSNAFNAAMENPDLTYCEGYATGIIPTLHAWVVDGNGVVHDPTWDSGMGRDYFGVPFDTGWLRSHTLSQGYYGVFGADIPSDSLIGLLRDGLPSAAINRTGSLSTEASLYDESEEEMEQPVTQRSTYSSLQKTASEAEPMVEVTQKGDLWTWRCLKCNETQPGRGYRDKTNTVENAEAHAMWCYDLDWGDTPIVREAGLHVEAADEQWLINGKPYSDGVWVEVEPDVWYRGAARPDEIPSRIIVRRDGDRWEWEAKVLTFINAPHEKKNPKGVAKTLEAAQERALRSLAKDHEFFQRYQERMRARLESVSSLQTEAYRDEPDANGRYYVEDDGEMHAYKIGVGTLPTFSNGGSSLAEVVAHATDGDGQRVASLNLLMEDKSEWPAVTSVDPQGRGFYVMGIKVALLHRRRGLATAMWAMVHRAYPTIPAVHGTNAPWEMSQAASRLFPALKRRWPRLHLDSGPSLRHPTVASLTSSLTKTADEDQCPACAGDSLRGGRGYICQDCGHEWNEDDVAARAYHGDGPMRGIPLGQFVDIPDLMIRGSNPAPKEGTKMDIPDEFGSLFDGAMEGIQHTAAEQRQVLAEWGFDPSYQEDSFAFIGPNDPHWSEGVPIPEDLPGEIGTIDQDPDAALPVTYGDEDDEADKVAARLASQLSPRTAGFPLCAKGCNYTLAADQPMVNTATGLAHAQCPRTASQTPTPDSRLWPPVEVGGAAQPPESEGQKASRLVAYADALARGETPEGPNPFAHLAGQEDSEIASHATNYLATRGGGIQTSALKSYSPVERQQIIEEGAEVTASNLDRLDIKGTHYEAIEQATAAKSEDEDLWLLDGDPNGPE